MAFNFLPASIKSRLLRFALSRIDFLDEDALDLDRLDFTLGKRSVVSLRDVGLRTKKISSFLPPHVQVNKATINLLRITIPADLYTSGIVVEVAGVTLKAKVIQEGFGQGKGRSEHIPTTQDLAESFLQDEPPEERRELEAAINSQSQYLQESTAATSLYSNEGLEESELGTGVGLTLPVVVTNFFNGIRDRLQVSIEGVQIEIETEIPPEGWDDVDPITAGVVFHVGKIDVEGPTSVGITLSPQDVSPTTPGVDPKAGKRQITLTNLCAGLLLDEKSMTKSRITSSCPASSARSTSLRSEPVGRAPSETSGHEFSSSPNIKDYIPSIGADVPPSPTSLRSSKPFEGMATSSITTDDDRFADADEDDHETLNPLARSLTASEMLDHQSAYGDESLLQHAVHDGFFDSNFDGEGSPAQSRASIGSASNSPVIAQHSHVAFSSNSLPGRFSDLHSLSQTKTQSFPASMSQPIPDHTLPQSVSHLKAASLDHSSYSGNKLSNSRRIASSGGSRNTSPSPASSEHNDLSQSRLFSHEEAESMYMSALSEAPSHSSRQFHIPGGWDTASNSSVDSDQANHLHPTQMGAAPLDSIAEKDDGCDTPRPCSQAGTESSSQSPERHRNDTEENGSAELSKLFTPLVDVDTVSLWIPNPDSAKGTVPFDASALVSESARALRVAFIDASIYQDVPGSFSHYAASTARPRAASTILKDPNRALANQTRIAARDHQPSGTIQDSVNGFEMAISSARLRLDVDTIYLMTRLVKAITWILGDLSSMERPRSRQEGATKERGVSGKCTVESIELVLLKELVGYNVSTAKPIEITHYDQIDHADILLKLHFKNLQFTGKSGPEFSKLAMDLGALELGFNDQNILTFSSGSGLEETTMGLKQAQECDLSLTYTQAENRAEVTVLSRPLHINLDVQKLDDTFASYGGFSGVLRIGNQIASTCVLPPPSSKPFTPKVPIAVSGPQNSTLKINAHVDGLTFRLQGEAYGVLLETSVIRAVVRKDKVGVVVKHAKFSGPHTPAMGIWTERAPLIADIDDIKIEYAFTPTENDLEDLLSLITPTHFEYEADDDILIDTLLSQRRKGSFIRIKVKGEVQLEISDLDSLNQFQCLGKDVAKLSSVAKLLPDDERPGILAMVDVAQCNVNIYVNERIGIVSLDCSKLRLAHIGLPSLIALEVGSIEAVRNHSETLVDQVNTPDEREAQIPTLMARILGDEMEPTLKVKLFNLLVDYRVSTIMAILGLSENSTAEEVALGMASSVATIKRPPSPSITRQSSGASEKSGSPVRPMNLDLLLRDCAVGLNPRKSLAKALLVLTDTRFSGSLVDDAIMTADLDIRKASLLVIDDVSRLNPDQLDPSVKPVFVELGNRQVMNLCRLGFVSVGTTSKARAIVKISEPEDDGPRPVEIAFNNDLFVMESCADSTQTLLSIFGGLAPPQHPSQATQYRTKVEPVVNMMASLVDEDLLAGSEGEPAAELNMEKSIIIDEPDPEGLHFEGSFYDPSQLPNLDEMTEDSIEESSLQSVQNQVTPGSIEDDTSSNIELNFEPYFGKASLNQPAAHGWDSRKNVYIEPSEIVTVKSPLTLRVRDVHFIWNLYDGYDWPRTREKLGQKLEEVQQRAQERRERMQHGEEDDGVTIEEDLLFGSVYVALPLNQTAEENRRQLNLAMKGKGADDTVSETSYATTTASRSTARPRSRHTRLKLDRGRHHKITFELKGVSADVVVFPPGINETQNSVDARVHDFEVIDHVPSSTWKKFVTYDHDAGERPMGAPMIRLEMLNVRPVPDLAASELVIKVSVLPLRLHVDQDALDFITRFFEFKDDRMAPTSATGEQPFIQRLEVRTVHLNLDYKPKKVDYAGLRSGHTTEFMNFVILEGANITLRRCIIYGISGFDKVHKTLNDIWMPDVKSNQIPSIIAGVAMFRGLANVGSGVRNLVTVPVREYKKDGRLIRSARKGVMAFAKTTTTEVLRLGGKVFIGTHAMLHGAEDMLSPPPVPVGSSHAESNWEEASSGVPSDEPRAFSNYADQPIGVRAGLVSARRHLQQDFASARDAIIAIPAEVMDSGSATGAAKAVAKRAPVVILRPLTGVAKATGATLFGAANALDKDSRRKIDDKYKRH